MTATLAANLSPSGSMESVGRSAMTTGGWPTIQTAPRVSVVIPTLNEEKNIAWVLERLPLDTHEVILVDGRSTDRTIEVARAVRPDLRVVFQPARGKGVALALGLAEVTGDIAVMIDADGSMDPAEIPALIGALEAWADVVRGSRLAAGGGSTDLTPIRRLGNWGLTFFANRLYSRNWRELCYGYAAFWTDVLPHLGVAEIGSPNGLNRRLDKQENETTRTRTQYRHGFENVIVELSIGVENRAALRHHWRKNVRSISLHYRVASPVGTVPAQRTK